MPQIKLQNQMVNAIGNEQRKQAPKPIDQYLQILIKQIKLKAITKNTRHAIFSSETQK